MIKKLAKNKKVKHSQSNKSVSLLPDSGSRTSFSTGAVRDGQVGKGLPHMIPPIAIRKMAKRFEDGATKYGPHNWMKGIPLSRYQDAMMRHLLDWCEGKTDEDHLGAVGWNYAAAAWTEQEIERGRLPATLQDLPFFEMEIISIKRVKKPLLTEKRKQCRK